MVTVLDMKQVCWLALRVKFEQVRRGRYRVMWRMWKEEGMQARGAANLNGAFSSGTAAEGFNAANEAAAGYAQLSQCQCRLKLKPGRVGGGRHDGAGNSPFQSSLQAARAGAAVVAGAGAGGAGAGGAGAAPDGLASPPPSPRNQGWLTAGGGGGGWWDVVVGELTLAGKSTSPDGGGGGAEDVHCLLQGSNNWIGGIKFAGVRSNALMKTAPLDPSCVEKMAAYANEPTRIVPPAPPATCMFLHVCRARTAECYPHSNILTF